MNVTFCSRSGSFHKKCIQYNHCTKVLYTVDEAHQHLYEKHFELFWTDMLKGFQLGDWFTHNKSSKSVMTRVKAKARKILAGILKGEWCCLCRDFFDKRDYYLHYARHFDKEVAQEVHPRTSDKPPYICEGCKGTKEFQTFQVLLSQTESQPPALSIAP